MPCDRLRWALGLLTPLLGSVLCEPEQRAWRQASGQALARYAAGRCDIPVISGEGFSAAAFAEKFSERTPVLVRGLTAAQATSEHWDRDAFTSAHGALTATRAMPLYTAQFGLPVKKKKKRSVGVREYIEGLGGSGAAATTLLFDRSQGKLGKRIMSLHGVPDAFAAMVQGETELPVVSLGPSRQGLSLHQHPQTWLSLVRGRKLWFLMAPDALQGHSAYETLAMRRPSEWPDRLLPSMLKHGKGLHVCEQLPGDVMYVPSLWYHATENDGDALGAGMQQVAPLSTGIYIDGSGGVKGAPTLYPKSAYVRDQVARDRIDKLLASREGDEKKRKAEVLEALEEIEEAVDLEPLDFFRRFNALKARARYAEMRGEDKKYITILLFKGWKAIEQLAVDYAKRSVLSGPQLAAVLIRIAEEIRTTLPAAEKVAKDVMAKLKADAKAADLATFDSLWSSVPPPQDANPKVDALYDVENNDLKPVEK